MTATLFDPKRKRDFETPAEDALDTFRDLNAYFLTQTRRLISTTLAVTERYQEVWRKCMDLACQDKLDEAHTYRDALADGLPLRLRLLREAIRAAGIVATWDDAPLPGSEALAPALQALERFQTRILARWNDADSLGYLVAEELMPSAQQLDAIAAKNGFPQAWYDEDSKPF